MRNIYFLILLIVIVFKVSGQNTKDTTLIPADSILIYLEVDNSNNPYYFDEEYSSYVPDSLLFFLCGQSKPFSSCRFLKPKHKSISSITDTLYVANRKLVDYYQDDVIYHCQYSYGKKHGIEYAFYDIRELKGICIQDNFMLKYKGKWDSGLKHGKWEYYDKNGIITSVQKYRKGKLKK